jgi:Cu-processing system permease protein
LKRIEVITAIARKELRDRLRNRWILIVSTLLVISAMIISYFGAGPVGLAGFQKTGMTLVSLINLAIYLVPLLALVLGSFLIIDERERGTLDLILSLPISTGEYLMGTLLGLVLALGASILLGFGAAGLILLWQESIVSSLEYLVFLLLAFGLGVIFLSISYIVSILSGDKGKAMAVSLFTWIFAVFLFDILLVGVLILSKGKIGSDLFGIILMLNPVDVFRLLTYSLIESAKAPIGLSTVEFPVMLSPRTLLSVFACWAVLLLYLVRWSFHRHVGFDIWSEKRKS